MADGKIPLDRELWGESQIMLQSLRSNNGDAREENTVYAL
jgi:hypothetical protein